jgi:TRAP-type C4-dicarboxylate transport system permease small subunit
MHNHEKGYFYERLKKATGICLRAVALLFFFILIFLAIQIAQP